MRPNSANPGQVSKWDGHLHTDMMQTLGLDLGCFITPVSEMDVSLYTRTCTYTFRACRYACHASIPVIMCLPRAREKTAEEKSASDVHASTEQTSHHVETACVCAECQGGDGRGGDSLDEYMSVVSSQLDPATVTRLKKRALDLGKVHNNVHVQCTCICLHV